MTRNEKEMTTIRSTYDSDYLCEITDGRAPGEIAVRLRVGIYGSSMQGWFSRADIIEALDATANADVKHRADVYEKLTEAEDKLAEVRQWFTRYFDSGAWTSRSPLAELDSILRGPDPIDAEARALHDAYFPESFTWENASGPERDKWRAVARKARESKTEKG